MTEEIIEVPYGDLYLKFTDEAQSLEVLAGYEGSIDVLGAVEGTDGWLVNTRGPITDALKAFSADPTPTTPIRVWA